MPLSFNPSCCQSIAPDVKPNPYIESLSSIAIILDLTTARS